MYSQNAVLCLVRSSAFSKNPLLILDRVYLYLLYTCLSLGRAHQWWEFQALWDKTQEKNVEEAKPGREKEMERCYSHVIWSPPAARRSKPSWAVTYLPCLALDPPFWGRGDVYNWRESVGLSGSLYQHGLTASNGNIICLFASQCEIVSLQQFWWTSCTVYAVVTGKSCRIRDNNESEWIGCIFRCKLLYIHGCQERQCQFLQHSPHKPLSYYM